MAFDLDLSVVMNGNDPHLVNRLSVLMRLLCLDPVHQVAGAIRPTGTIPRHRSAPERLGLHYGRRSCPAPAGAGRFVIRATQRAWGWRAVQSELGDGNS